MSAAIAAPVTAHGYYHHLCVVLYYVKIYKRQTQLVLNIFYHYSVLFFLKAWLRSIMTLVKQIICFNVKSVYKQCIYCR